jgi:ABC-type glycerol-3-phosphate transport system substrate-binding protein
MRLQLYRRRTIMLHKLRIALAAILVAAAAVSAVDSASARGRGVDIDKTLWQWLMSGDFEPPFLFGSP